MNLFRKPSTHKPRNVIDASPSFIEHRFATSGIEICSEPLIFDTPIICAKVLLYWIETAAHRPSVPGVAHHHSRANNCLAQYIWRYSIPYIIIWRTMGCISNNKQPGRGVNWKESMSICECRFVTVFNRIVYTSRWSRRRLAAIPRAYLECLTQLGKIVNICTT